ncbi:hypothetical protein COBT_001910 [Conglomerata obtusa]
MLNAKANSGNPYDCIGEDNIIDKDPKLLKDEDVTCDDAIGSVSRGQNAKPCEKPKKITENTPINDNQDKDKNSNKPVTDNKKRNTEKKFTVKRLWKECKFELFIGLVAVLLLIACFAYFFITRSSIL